MDGLSECFSKHFKPNVQRPVSRPDPARPESKTSIDCVARGSGLSSGQTRRRMAQCTRQDTLCSAKKLKKACTESGFIEVATGQTFSAHPSSEIDQILCLRRKIFQNNVLNDASLIDFTLLPKTRWIIFLFEWLHCDSNSS